MSERVYQGQVRNVGGRKCIALWRTQRGWVVGTVPGEAGAYVLPAETRGDLHRWPVVVRVQLRSVADRTFAFEIVT